MTDRFRPGMPGLPSRNEPGCPSDPAFGPMLAIGKLYGGRQGPCPASMNAESPTTSPTVAPLKRSPSPTPVTPPPPIVRLVNVRKAFGRQVVLNHFSLDIATGKTTVVLGPSGCGKSVMLKHLVGLLHP